MERVVVDSSVWITYFKNKTFTIEDQVESLLLEDRIVSCGVVESELLCAASPAERKAIEAEFSELAYEEFTRKDFRHAAQLYREMRSQGRTLTLSDLLIAAFCIERGLLLLTLDKDFKGIPRLEKVAPNLP